MERLSSLELSQALTLHETWQLVDEKWLEKRFRFSKFMDGIHFVNDIAALSEEVNHHPLISIDYKVVTLKLTSWRAKGITDLDIELIEKYDNLYQKYGDNK